MTLRHLLHAVVETGRISAPTVVEAAFGRLLSETCDARLDRWARRILARAKIELTTVGVEHAVAGEAFVVMSNHQSLYDIPSLYSALRRPMRMVAKGELFRIPLWGSAMRKAGFVPVDRSDRSQAIESLASAKFLVSSGVSLWIAPEGTRSVDGKLGAFKRGGFHLAEDAGARILPVSILGTERVLGARSRHVSDGVHVTVVVHPPVDPRDYGPDRRDELIAAVRASILSALREPGAMSGEAGAANAPISTELR